MSSFPGSPRVTKGAIIGIDPFNPLASVVVFQYNPDTLTRTVTAQTAGDLDKGEALRLKGPPRETIKLDVVIDATDQLEQANAMATTLGIYPALASLEMLLYPKAATVVANDVLAAAGVIEVIAPEMPLTLLVWGVQRIVPVRLTELSITEEAFDPNLNPIRATVSLTVTVLTYQDLGLLSVGGALSMAHQVASEVLATAQGVGNLASLGSTLPAGIG